MPRYKVGLLAVVGLAVIGLAAWLYLQGRGSGLGMPPPVTVKHCRWEQGQFPQSENTCLKRCGHPYTEADLALQGQDGPPGQQKNYFFCCPKGYLSLCEQGGFHVCSSRSCDQLPKGDD
jgi:hypothetical protein